MLCYFTFCIAYVGRLGKIRDSNQISTKRGRGQQESNGIPQELFKLNLVAQLGFIHMLPHRINTLGLGQHLFSVFVVVTVFFVVVTVVVSVVVVVVVVIISCIYLSYYYYYYHYYH